MHIESLERCVNAKEVREMLKVLPRGLEESYEQILAKSPRRRDLLQILHFLAFSARTMRLKELAEVVSIDFDSADGPCYDADLKYSDPCVVLTICAGLATETEGMCSKKTRTPRQLKYHPLRRSQAGPFLCQGISHL